MKVLHNEVLALRYEVAQLKVQLLAHRDCPVTLALCNNPPANQQTIGWCFFFVISFSFGRTGFKNLLVFHIFV